MGRIQNLVDYVEAYQSLHGLEPVIQLKGQDTVWIRHNPKLYADDAYVEANMLEDLPEWTAFLLEQVQTRSALTLFRRLALVNTREVFAYELSAFEGS